MRGPLGTRHRLRVGAAVAATVAAAVLVGLTLGGRDERPRGPTASVAGGAPGGDAGVGSVARLAGGAVARLNRVEPGVSVAPGAPPPEPGLHLVRLDVEVCAGERELMADPALWVGIADDGATYSAHTGVHGLVTLTMAPGGCQRGTVDLAVDGDVRLSAVVLMDEPHEAVARWSVDGGRRPDEPLRSTVLPEEAVTGTPVELAAGGVVTLLRTSGVRGSRAMLDAEGEICAGDREDHTSPRSWLVQLSDHRVVRAEREGSTIAEGAIAPGRCVSGTARFRLPDDARPTAVLYAYGGIFEEARWRLDR